jgi:uncharacterized protein YqjF (DUF2071 family)
MVVPLRHLAMVTYSVPAARVRALVPPQFALETRTDGQGDARAFVSAVMFLNERLHLSRFPWLPFTFPQVNYRTYVRYRGVPGAYFFAITLRSRLALVQRRLFGAPTFTVPIQFEVEWDAESKQYLRYHVWSDAPGHGLNVELARSDEAFRPDALFSSFDEMVEFLTHRLAGFYVQPESRQVWSLEVWHELMRPLPGVARRAEFTILERLGLVPPSEQPQPYTVFIEPGNDLYAQNPRRSGLLVPGRAD